MKHPCKIYALIAAIAFPGASVLAADSGTRPNIVFIMADDHATRAISAYNPETPLATPNLDRLASQGMRFSNMSCVNSVCGPSRANLLSGRHTAQNGFFSNFDEFDGSQPTFPKLLQAAGYQTAIVGKWHLNSRPTGFDYYSILAGHGRFFDSPFLGPKDPWRKIEVSEGYLTDVITDKSIDWMRHAAPIDFILSADLLEPENPPYKLLIPAGPMTDEGREMIEKYLEQNDCLLGNAVGEFPPENFNAELPALMERAGVHRYLEGNANVWASTDLIQVQSPERRIHTLHFPHNGTVKELLSGDVLEIKNNKIERSFTEWDVQVFARI